jgi:glycosyltransferase involved in cell wall biosynthesis
MMADRRAPVTAVVLTYNEEVNLPACLASLAGCVERIVVVDSGSTDRTIGIAREAGAEILTHPFETHSGQWKWAMENIGALSPWVLGLDADQRVTPELADEIARVTGAGVAEDVAGFHIKRRQVFRGRWIRHGGYYPKYLLKLFRRDRVWFDEHDLVDHHFYVRGATARLRHDLIEANLKEDDLEFWIAKHVRYARLMAQEEHARTNGAGGALTPNLLGDPDHRSAWFKRVWGRLPLFVRPWLYFFYRYVLRLGFLDGREGLIFHFMQGCWFRFMVDVHLSELRHARRLTNQ